MPLITLCVTEITSWGVLFYAFPVLAPAITADTGWSNGTITAAFSAALVLSALGGIPLGRALDRHGPRHLMTAGSLLGALGLAGVAFAPGLGWFVAAWLVVGAAMSAVLYQPAFAALTRYYAPRHVAALTTLTLVAGLASTVFAPLTGYLAAQLSWRETYAVLAVVLVTTTVPLHWYGLRRPWPVPLAHRRESGDDVDAGSTPATSPATEGPGVQIEPAERFPVAEVVRGRRFLLLAVALTLSAFSMYAVLIHLVPLLMARGASATVAAWALGLGGVGQVAGRLCYAALERRSAVRFRTVAVMLVSAGTIGALAVLPGPVALLVAVSVLAGTTRGIATLLQATAVSDRWGTAAYGTLSGILAAPATIAGALAPWGGAVLATVAGGYPAMFAILAVTGALAAAAALGTAPERSGVGADDSVAP